MEWDTPLRPLTAAGEPIPALPDAAAALLRELLEACELFPEVRAVSVEHAEDGPAFRVWVTAFVAPLQLELDRLQAANRALVIIALRLPPGIDRPSVGPEELLYARAG